MNLLQNAWTMRCLHPPTPETLITLLLKVFGYCYLNSQSQILKSLLAGASVALRECRGQQVVKLSRMVYPQPDALTPSRNDVLVGTFNTDLLNVQFQRQNATIGLTIAETHFMVGHRVNYYIFTHQPGHVLYIKLQDGWRMVILQVRSYAHWQDITMHLMEVIRNFPQQHFLREVDYLVCADVDMKFSDHVGVEILSSLFATIHPGFYRFHWDTFAYEHQPQSQAHIPDGKGDFYYTGALFGGSVLKVYRLTTACHQVMTIEQANHIEAPWDDESHLNKYLLNHKPTKVLSPEYMWDKKSMECMLDEHLLGSRTMITRKRSVVLVKNNEEMRTDEGSFQKETREGVIASQP
uniref:Uncharacterized protein n=1 Tax=Piliocolobus tephrosceles TaxID=591936 RepID=A0A8C9HFA6_9PRIM